jgi:glutamate 5-kinase
MRTIIKIGSNLLTGTGQGIDQRRVGSIVKSIAALRALGHEVVVVSSGAVAAGVKRLGLKARPREVKLKQAAAAVGQSALMQTYEKHFGHHGLTVAQILLTRDGLANREMYINAKNTLLTLLHLGVVPIVNENDTVATEEIKFGDNDNLAALVASLAEATRLVILSDVDGLYEADPRRNPKARLIRSVECVSPEVMALAGGAGSAFSTGGMLSKLQAAEKATASGISVTILNGRRTARLVKLFTDPEGSVPCTNFVPGSCKLPGRKGWIAYGSRTKGTLVLDAGAVKALVERQKSLLPSGITSVDGAFKAGDSVRCTDASGAEVARGLVNYAHDEIRRIMGRKTSEIEGILGFRYSDEVIHRDNMFVVED